MNELTPEDYFFTLPEVVKPTKTIYVTFMLEGGSGKGLLNRLGSTLSGFIEGRGWKTTTVLDVYKIDGEWYAETKNTIYKVRDDW